MANALISNADISHNDIPIVVYKILVGLHAWTARDDIFTTTSNETL